MTLADTPAASGGSRRPDQGDTPWPPGNRRKAYVTGSHPGVRVPVVEVTTSDGEPPVRLYYT